MKKFLIIIVILAVIAAVVVYFVKKKAPDTESKIEYAEVTRGDIENVVSSTGALETTGTVEVGTQISGTVDRVLVDYNDVVKVDQVLAVMDTTQLHLTMESSRAELQASKARMLQAKLEYESNQELFEKELISEYDLEESRIGFMAAEASYTSVSINYQKNRNNLELYSVIRSPINGTVIDRDVEEGQTVAASLSAPTLFTIAKDLSRMEILAYVDESDIGEIRKGMAVQFTVDAFPDNTYSGEVKQVRLMPETVSNVVNYIVVISADNHDLKLMPGMTATVDFIIEQKQDVLMVSNAALKFRPSMQMMRQTMERKRSERGENAPPRRSEGEAGNGNGGNRPSFRDMSMLWFFNDKGELDMMPVKAGSTDGVNTEISGRNLAEGIQCVTKMETDEESSGSNGGLFGMPRPGRRGR